MATDKTMPPNDPSSLPSMPPGAMPPGAIPGGAPAGADASAVMISMPRVVFDELHNIVRQLAAGVEELAKRVGPSGGAGMPMEPADQAAGEDMPAEGSSADEDFLREMANQANK